MSIEGQAKGVLDNSTTQAKDLANDTMKEGRKVFARAADQVVPAVKQTLADVEESASDFFASTTDRDQTPDSVFADWIRRRRFAGRCSARAAVGRRSMATATEHSQALLQLVEDGLKRGS